MLKGINAQKKYLPIYAGMQAGKRFQNLLFRHINGVKKILSQYNYTGIVPRNNSAIVKFALIKHLILA
jgi:hypothetical protein